MQSLQSYHICHICWPSQPFQIIWAILDLLDGESCWHIHKYADIHQCLVAVHQFDFLHLICTYTGYHCRWVRFATFSPMKLAHVPSRRCWKFPGGRLMKKPVADDGDENTTRNIQACPTKSLCAVYRTNWTCQNPLGPACLTSTSMFYFTPWFASTFQDWSDYIWATSATSWFLASPCFILTPCTLFLAPSRTIPSVSFWPPVQKSRSGRSETVESRNHRNPPKYIKIHRAVVFLFPVSRPLVALLQQPERPAGKLLAMFPRKGTTPDVYFKFETPLGIGDPPLDRKKLKKLTLRPWKVWVCPILSILPKGCQQCDGKSHHFSFSSWGTLTQVWQWRRVKFGCWIQTQPSNLLGRSNKVSRQSYGVSFFLSFFLSLLDWLIDWLIDWLFVCLFVCLWRAWYFMIGLVL